MTKKSSFISIIGAPNAGKSTLLNKLIGSKVSIVTPKVQTTRTRITGILTKGDTQLVFIDTPGIFRPRKEMEKAMVKAALGSLSGIDCVLLIVDAKRPDENNLNDALASLKKGGMKKILVLNKVDITKKEALLHLAIKLNESVDFEQTFMISALENDGIEDLEKYLLKNAKEASWMYPEDQVSDMPMRMFAAEITREKLMMRLNQELPYMLMVETENWEENDNGIKINQVIYVTSESHKKIVIGKGGETIKHIGQQAREELSFLLEKKVSVFLFVKIKEKWQNAHESYEIMGLDNEE